MNVTHLFVTVAYLVQ